MQTLVCNLLKRRGFATLGTLESNKENTCKFRHYKKYLKHETMYDPHLPLPLSLSLSLNFQLSWSPRIPKFPSFHPCKNLLDIGENYFKSYALSQPPLLPPNPHPLPSPLSSSSPVIFSSTIIFRFSCHATSVFS